jgi:hypothetical protein
VYNNTINNLTTTTTITLDDHGICEGYSGFNLFIEAPNAGTLTMTVTIIGKNYTELDSTENSPLTLEARSFSFTESNLTRNASYPLININPKAIQLTFENVTHITSLNISLTFGYLWQERLEPGVFKALLYNADNSASYYNPELSSFTCDLGAKLLSISIDEGGFIAIP